MPVGQKRHAVASALAASSLVPLVMARGHRIAQVSELPLVVSDGLESVTKTKEAFETLKKLGLTEELTRIADSKKIRAGKGKARNRRYVMRKGPMVIFNEDNGIVRAFRNIPGIETINVTRMNILRLAPGGHFGRLILWTEGAFRKLSAIYGTLKSGAPMKKGYTLPRAQMENADIARIINSTEVQSVLRPKIEAPKKFEPKKNALKSKTEMEKLNPAAAETMELHRRQATKGTPEYAAVQKRKAERKEEVKAHRKKYKTGDDTFYKTLMRAFETKKAAPEEEKDEE